MPPSGCPCPVLGGCVGSSREAPRDRRTRIGRSRGAESSDPACRGPHRRPSAGRCRRAVLAPTVPARHDGARRGSAGPWAKTRATTSRPPR
eukprot:35097-Prymnesium_polylepis.1